MDEDMPPWLHECAPDIFKQLVAPSKKFGRANWRGGRQDRWQHSFELLAAKTADCHHGLSKRALACEYNSTAVRPVLGISVPTRYFAVDLPAKI
jgi:hypothetical protein